LSTQGLEPFDLEAIEAMLYSIDSYVTWESLEGGPYRKIGELIERKAKSLANYNPESHGQRLVHHIERQPTLEADFYFAEGRYRIRYNKKWDEYLKKVAMEKMPSEYGDFFCKK